MTGNPNVDPQLRSTADALKRETRSRGYRDVDQSVLSRELGPGKDVSTVRNRVGASCLVRVDVLAHDLSGVSLLVVVQTARGDQSAYVQSSLTQVTDKVLQAAIPLIPPASQPTQEARPPLAKGSPYPPPAQQPEPAYGQPRADDDRVVLTDGRVLEGVVNGFTGGSTLTIQLVDGSVLQVPWARVKQVIPHAGDSWTPDSGLQTGCEEGCEPPKADWSKRGGSLFTMDVLFQITGVLARTDHAFVLNYPDGQKMTFTGDVMAGGGGGTAGFHFGFMQMAIPDPAEGSTIWAFRLGTGVDLGAAGFALRKDSRTDVGLVLDGSVRLPYDQFGGDITWTTATLIMVPLIVGGQVGIGSFECGGVWRGAMLGLNWHPTYTYMNNGDLDPYKFFNYAGVQAHIDIGSIKAAARQDANFQIAVTFLPKIDRNTMYISLGFGTVWY